MSLSKKRTKLQMLHAVFELFHESIREVPDDVVMQLINNWQLIKDIYLNPPPGVKPSQLTAGLEQGLLELPAIISSVGAIHRQHVAAAIQAAIETEYPAFLEIQEARLSKIRSRGRISTEAEFFLVRHAIDVAEIRELGSNRLAELYQFVEAFEARGSHAG